MKDRRIVSGDYQLADCEEREPALHCYGHGVLSWESCVCDVQGLSVRVLSCGNRLLGNKLLAVTDDAEGVAMMGRNRAPFKKGGG